MINKSTYIKLAEKLYTDKLIDKASKIELLAFDVDGVLTDGKLYFSDRGEELKAFNIKDGLGIKLLKINNIGAGIITARQGIFIDDSITHIGDTNTKIRFPAADTISFETGGGERARITGDGPHLLLGGTTDVNEITESSANAGMVIGGTGFGNGGLAIINSTSGTGRIYFGDAIGSDAARNRGQINYYHNGDYMMFATAGGERLRITSGGNLLAAGITTSNTGFMFGTNGEHYLYKSAANTATLRVTSDGPYVEFKDVSGDVQLGSASGTLRLSASAAEKVRIQADGSCYFGPQIITEADMNWGHDAHQRPFIFSGNQAGVNPADATIVVANPNTDPPSTRLGSFMFGCKTSSGGNSGIKAYIEGWTTSNPSNTYEAGGYIKFVTRQSGYGLTEHFKIDHDGKLYKLSLIHI